MNPKVCMVTGANRGLGLEFVKQLLRLADPPKLIFAGCRNPDQAQELKKISESNASVKLVKIDLGDLSCLDETKKQVEALCGEDGINLLINNAGMFKVVQFEDTAESLCTFLNVNAAGTFCVTQTFLPLIKKAAKAQPGDHMSVNRAAVINITSDSGSIGFGVKESFATDGPMYGYRMSKAAQNMFTANLAHDVKPDKVLVACLHPGWVATDGGLSAVDGGVRGGAEAADLGIISTEASISGMFAVMEKFTEKDAGRYTDWEGHDWPW